MITAMLWLGGLVALLLLVLAGLLHALPRLGAEGRAVSAWFCVAPGLDAWITIFTIVPMASGLIALGWPGLLGAVIGQVVALLVWTALHELAHPEASRGPRIVHTINRAYGRWRNHTAVWITALAVPVFWVVRVAELVVYPPLTWLVGLPRYDQKEWVNVSRHKFRGLVGHDLIWCLYCDWMTGVWSLGSEMLRNVESFWCPIRFDSSKKCANCAVDFPDVEGGWAKADGTMSDVVRALEQHYPLPAPDRGLTRGAQINGINTISPWFGHPVRLTVRGGTAGTGSASPAAPAVPPAPSVQNPGES